jgi:tetratricopeptide (TPR) repeat protein
MVRSALPEHFIGREKELTLFKTWLCDLRSDAPWILFVHDALPDPTRRGGVGKTWLLRACAALAQQRFSSLPVVTVDCFHVADRDRLLIAERVVQALQTAYPFWQAQTFSQALETYRAQGYLSGLYPEKDVADIRIRDSLSEALAEDLAALERQLPADRPSLLLLVDTFELIEQQMQIAVLGLDHTFPDPYGLHRLKVLVAGRNEPDWQHPNWQGRRQEVLTLPLAPFTFEEMQQYLAAEVPELLPADERPESPATEPHAPPEATAVPTLPQATAAHPLAEERQVTHEQLLLLHRLTDGRPILIGLAIDVLQQRLLTLEELLTIPPPEFEAALVAQVNRLENPLNWIILLMAHIYYHCTWPLLRWILEHSSLREAVRDLSPDRLLPALLALSFVRRSSSGEEFVLHDEMRRLVVTHCWERQDPDRRFRRELSSVLLQYTEQRLAGDLSEQERQLTIVERLYHECFLEVQAGLAYFEPCFREAVSTWRAAFARSLLTTVQPFAGQLPPEQRWLLQMREVTVLRLEERPAAALARLDALEQAADPAWRQQQRLTLALERARCLLQQSQIEAARQAFEQVLTLAQAEGQQQQAAGLLSQLGYLARRLGRFDEALHYYQESLRTHRQLGNRAAYADLLNSIGNLYRRFGRIEEALRYCKLGLRLREQLLAEGVIGERSVGLSLNTLGMAYLDAGEVKLAEEQFLRARAIFTQIDYKTGIAANYNHLGRVALALGRLEEAQACFEKSIAVAASVDEEVYISSHHKLALVTALQGRWSEAAATWRHAVTRARTVHDQYQLVESLVELVGALERLGQREEAARCWQEARQLAEQEQYPLLLARGEEVLGDVRLEQGQVLEACEHYGVCCRYLAQTTAVTYTRIKRKLFDALLQVPLDALDGAVEALETAWRAAGLEQEQPDFLEMCEEVKQFRIR